MKKRICAMLLIFSIVFSIIPFGVIQVNAAAIDTIQQNLGYTFSSSYKNGPYYKKLQNIELNGNTAKNVISIASSQVGYHESNSSNDLSGTASGSGNYTEYNNWFYNKPQSASWCASFISWCICASGFGNSNKSSYNIFPKTANANCSAYIGSEACTVYSWYSIKNKKTSFTPKEGDIIIYSYTKSTSETVGNCGDHVGLITNYELLNNNYVFDTIEGNTTSATKVDEKKRSVGSNDYHSGLGMYVYAIVHPHYHNCKDYYNNKGICSQCTTEFPYWSYFDSSYAGTYKVTSASAPARIGPYAACSKEATLSTGTTITVEGRVINSYHTAQEPHYWYQIKYNGKTLYVYSTHLTKQTTSTSTTQKTSTNPDSYTFPSKAVNNANYKSGAVTASEIKWVQAILYQFGYLTSSGIDGKFGPGSVQATKNFQSANGLTVDGSAGPNTLNKMKDLWNKKNNPHTCSFTTYSYSKSNHPHYKVYSCSCGATNTSTVSSYVSSCTSCNPPHVHNYNIYASCQPAHPHKSIYACSCGTTAVIEGTSNKISDCSICFPKPSSSTVSVDKIEFVSGETINITWTPASNAAYYNLKYVKDGIYYTIASNLTSTSYKYQFSLVGTAYIYVDACNSNGYTQSNLVEVTSLDKPGWFWLETENRYIDTNTPITVNWSSSSYASSYSIKYEYDNETYYYAQYLTDAYDYELRFLIPGSYKVYIESEKNNKICKSNELNIVVSSPDKPIGLEYSIKDGEVTITNYTEYATTLAIPEFIDGYKVTTIGDNAFYDCYMLESITLPDTITEIGASAFSLCKNLKQITIPDNVSVIGHRAFSGCSSLESIRLPNNITTISDALFFDCSKLKNVQLGNKITTIGVQAFDYCSAIESITLPDGVKTIDFMAFAHCESLKNITIPYSLKLIEEFAFSNGTELINIYYLGDSEQWANVLVMDGNIGISSAQKHFVQHKGGIATCCEKAKCEDCGSYYGNLNENNHTGNVELQNKTNATCTSDGYSGDIYCVDCDTVLETGNVIQAYGHKTGAWFGIGSKTYHVCSYCGKLTDTCLITSWNVIVEATCSTLGEKQGYCNICGKVYETVSIPKLPHISGEWNIIEPATATSSGIRIKSCESCEMELERDEIAPSYNGVCGTQAKWQYNIDEKKLTIFGTGEMYNYTAKEPAPWQKLDILSIVVDDGITSIGNYAFTNCTWVGEIKLPDTVVSIGDYSFKSCINLTYISLPDNITTIGSFAFDGCKELPSINIPSKLNTLSSHIFTNCVSFTEFTIPSNIKTLENGVFSGCSGLINFVFPETVESIGESTFFNCSNLKNVTFSDSITSIPSCTFFWCENLTTVAIGKNAKNIGLTAFEHCDNLAEIYYNGTEQEWNTITNVSALSNIPIQFNHCINHILGDWVVTQATTCTSNGSETQYCTRCNEVIATQTIECQGHAPIEWVVIVEPSCTKTGIEKCFCSECGKECASKEIALKPHNYDNDCDTTCNYCNETRAVQDHIYDSIYDTTCNICGVINPNSPGDTNGDGKINGRDYALVLQSINGWDVTVDKDAADVNGDGKVNGRDYALLLQFINGWDVALQ